VFRLAAHVTLFHALPGEHEDAVAVDLAAAARRPPFEVAVTGLRLLGRGVAYTLDSPELAALRAGLAGAQLQVRPLPNSYHVATLDHDAGILFSGTIDFIRSHGSIVHEEAHRG